MEDYRPNSHTYKEQQKNGAHEKKVEKIVKNTVEVKKKSDVRKLADAFISDEAANVKSYVLLDVIIPTIKETIVDIIKDSVEMIFLGGTGRSSKKRSGSSSGSYVSYRNYSDRDRRDDRRDERGPRSRFDLDDIRFETRGDAEAVLEQMRDIIDTYKTVSVGDLYDMIDKTAPYTANDYGWTSLRNAYAERVRGGGYSLKLPRPLPLD